MNDYDISLKNYTFEHCGGLTYRLRGTVKESRVDEVRAEEEILTAKFTSFEDEKIGDIIETVDGIKYLLSEEVGGSDSGVVFN